MDYGPSVLSGRYQVGGMLGAGGFGEVFSAIDEHTGDRVAVKRLTRLDAQSIMWFKREFRLLADCAHRHLVKYHELINHADEWWLVMDYIEGTDLRTWVHRTESEPDSTRTLRMAEPLPDGGSVATMVPAPPLDQLQLERLRRLLPQLEAALTYLHSRGVVHRDLKPANIRVTRDERLVLLDFGLASPLAARAVASDIAGTLRYMAPEQSQGEILPASDWYSVGVILYSMLHGMAPFQGDASSQMESKRQGPRSIQRRPRTGHQPPDDLCSLSEALLDPDPERRPHSLLGPGGPPAPRRAPAFVGRLGELGVLRTRLAQATADGQGSLVLLHGPSGIGKSALVQAFIEGVRCEPGSLVLQGRCFQRESVPFKALDGVVDGLAEHLALQPPAVVARLMPRYGQQLVHLFPVLRELPGMPSPSRRQSELEPQEARRRGLLALRELLVRLGEARPLVLVIDDLHCSDDDSLAALATVLCEPDPPPLLAIACCRSGDEEPRPALAHLQRTLVEARVPLQLLMLGPLADAEAEELAMAAARERTQEVSDTFIRQAQAGAHGHPLLLLELVRASTSEPTPPTVAALLTSRFDGLPEKARQLAECLAVAGRPRLVRQLQRCAGLEEGTVEALAWLRAERLVRTQGLPAGEEVTLFHDQVGDAILGALGPDGQRRWHARWADELLASAEPQAEAEALHRHCLAAGRGQEARSWALVAAARAEAALAFEHAAGLFATVLAETPDDGVLRERLADVLAAAGRGPEAAREYLAAASRLEGPQARRAVRRAAGQFLRSGHMEEGLTAAASALEAVGERWPASQLWALVLVQLQRWRRLRLRQALPPAEQAPGHLERMDTLWEIAHGLGGVDTIRAAALNGRHLAMAFASGDPFRATKGMAWEAILSFAMGGPRMLARGWTLVERSAGLAMRCDRPHARAWAQAAAGYGHWCEGRLLESISASAGAVEAYRDEGRDVAWELGSVIAWCWAPALAAAGHLTALRRLTAESESEFSRLGDLYTLTTLRTVAKPLLHLVDGQPAAARAEVAEAIARWSDRHWHLQHLFAAFACCRADLYEGRPAEALSRLDAIRPKMEQAFQHRLQIKRIMAWHLRSCALAQLGERGLPGAGQRLRALATTMLKEGLGWSSGHGWCARAAALAGDGRMSEAMEAYRSGAALYTSAGMELHALAASWRAADCAAHGGAGEAEMCAGALSSRGVADPLRLRVVLVAGSRATHLAGAKASAAQALGRDRAGPRQRMDGMVERGLGVGAQRPHAGKQRHVEGEDEHAHQQQDHAGRGRDPREQHREQQRQRHHQRQGARDQAAHADDAGHEQVDAPVLQPLQVLGVGAGQALPAAGGGVGDVEGPAVVGVLPAVDQRLADAVDHRLEPGDQRHEADHRAAHAVDQLQGWQHRKAVGHAHPDRRGQLRQDQASVRSQLALDHQGRQVQAQPRGQVVAEEHQERLGQGLAHRGRLLLARQDQAIERTGLLVGLRHQCRLQADEVADQPPAVPEGLALLGVQHDAPARQAFGNDIAEAEQGEGQVLLVDRLAIALEVVGRAALAAERLA